MRIELTRNMKLQTQPTLSVSVFVEFSNSGPWKEQKIKNSEFDKLC